MEKLSAEIIHMIAAQCNLTSLKALRLTSKYISAASARPLFEEVFVIAVDSSMEKLQSIAKHPRYSTYVKKLTFMGGRLPEIDWQLVDEIASNADVDVEEALEDISSTYEDHRRPYEEQKSQPWEMNAQFLDAISGLPNLRSMLYTDGSVHHFPALRLYKGAITYFSHIAPGEDESSAKHLTFGEMTMNLFLEAVASRANTTMPITSLAFDIRC